jgi:sugar phosphate permease
MSYVLRIPTYRLLILASALGYFFFAGIRAFVMIYFTQHYGVSRSTFSALVIIVGFGALAGVIMGGRISEWLLDRRKVDARIIVPGVALLLSVVFAVPAVITTRPTIGIALLTLAAGALAAANPAIDAARLDIIHPRLWGRAEAGRTALRSGLEGSAPILFGLVSGWLGGGESGLEWTYLVMMIPLLIASALAIPARRSYPADVATAAASIQETSGQKSRLSPNA